SPPAGDGVTSAVGELVEEPPGEDAAQAETRSARTQATARFGRECIGGERIAHGSSGRLGGAVQGERRGSVVSSRPRTNARIEAWAICSAAYASQSASSSWGWRSVSCS